MKRLWLLILAFLLVFSACGDPTPSGGLPDTPEISQGPVDPDADFQSGEENIRFFTPGEGGGVWAVTDSVALGKYEMDGTLIEDSGLTNDLMCLYYHLGKVYAYDKTQNAVVVYDTAAKNLRTIAVMTEEIYDIKNLVVAGDYVYLLNVPTEALFPAEGHDHEDDEVITAEGYIDFHEQVDQIRISDGAIRTLDAPNTMAIYRGQNDVLYLYRCPGVYGLYSYDATNDAQRLISDMSDIKYIHAFVYEQENFTFIKTGTTSDTPVANKRMADGQIVTLKQGIYTGPGSHVQYYAGNLVMRDRETFPPGFDPAGKSPEELVAMTMALRGELVSLYLGDTHKETPENNAAGGSLTVYSWRTEVSTEFRMESAYEESGIRAKFIFPTNEEAYNTTSEAFLLDLMSGDESVDIYLLMSNIYCSLPLRNRGMYVPLNDSLVIGDYLDGCFDYIKEAATAPNGDIWMLPLWSDTDMLWYTPESFAELDLSPEDLRDFDSYAATLERLRDSDSDRKVFVHPSDVYFAWEGQYNAAYNDFENGFADYDTELFRTLLQRVFGGWTHDMMSSDKGGYLTDDPFYSAGRNRYLDFDAWLDPDRVIFKSNSATYQLSDPFNHVQRTRTEIMETWRALPMPLLTEECSPSEVYVNYAMVNPFGKNKETAIAYLESVARHPHRMTKSPVFMEKSIESYKDTYDTSLPCFQDVYSIFQNAGGVRFAILPNGEGEITWDYQNGLLTLDEAIAAIQRETEMRIGE